MNKKYVNHGPNGISEFYPSYSSWRVEFVNRCPGLQEISVHGMLVNGPFRNAISEWAEITVEITPMNQVINKSH